MDKTPQDAATTRRKSAVGGWVGSFAVVQTVTVRPAPATPASLAAAIGEVVGDAPVRQGKVRLELPPLVENGNAVSLTVSVESPMTEAAHVTSIHIFNEKNPQPNVVIFHLGPRAGRARASTRIRLADSQKVVAVRQAKLARSSR
jgi:sulfur-oxidizing protein SoxY